MQEFFWLNCVLLQLIEYVHLFFHSKNIDICNATVKSLGQHLIRELQAALQTNTGCEYTNFETRLTDVVSKNALSSSDRRRFTQRLVRDLFDGDTCGMKKQLSDYFMSAEYHVIAWWFRGSATITDRIFEFHCEVDAARRDLARYRRIIEDPDKLWMLEHLIIYALRNQVDMTITKKEFIRKVFLATEDYKWWPQNRFYPKMVECMSRMFESYARDLSEMKQDEVIHALPLAQTSNVRHS
ncbi:hypothetical protein RF11_04034 [Thelohanellus kitauei]|uniref:Uncharacterized protein n=1 Tax=Thelohanellus kitauei TaxID=669202 RepID=A0A0C2J114_THEKT|nr:hypothetical protein RF11_04034 [Thelohanellus kitauei]